MVKKESTIQKGSGKKQSVKPKRKPMSPQTKKRIIFSSITLALCLFFTGMPILINELISYPTYAKSYTSATSVGYHAEYLGTYKRNNIPKTTQDGGMTTGYPTYGRTLSLTQEQKTEMIAENRSLCGVGTRVDVSLSAQNTYDSMDSEGNLYLRGERLERKLYKHTGSVGLYGGNISDNEPALRKKFTMKGRGGGQGYLITGLYAPAGEVIKIEMSKEDVAATGGLVVYIGQALYNGQANNIWESKNFNRMPIILNMMVVNANTTTAEVDKDGNYTFYVGSFLGGPIYIQPGHTNATFSTTISGGVAYSHFILGYTTPQEFNRNKNSSAPYFDLMVWDSGVLHSGPKAYAQNFSYEELYDAAILWEKISLVSTAVKGTTCGIVFLYDPFVAAGAAVAFPGRNSVNCPAGWMGGSLNYKSFVNSGAWGNMHEYNHNFQGWGLPGGGEVTNNALNLVEYSLFTRISAARHIGSVAEGLGGWNAYTNPSWTVRQVSGSMSNALSIYATLLHSFGQQNFISSTRSAGVDGYYTKWADLTHNDMRYFESLVRAKVNGMPALSEPAQNAMAEKNYPMYVPVASVYQTGCSYMYDGVKKYVETAQPYTIIYNQDFTIDLRKYTFDGNFYINGSIATPEGFSVKVKGITQPEYGKIVTTDTEGVYTYVPDRNHMRSGKIIATIEITKDDGEFEVEDVDLVLEFEQSHELNKTIVQRTTYKYSPENMFTSPVEAYEANYGNYESKTDEDNNNYIDGRLVQNANSEIWALHGNTSNTIMELRGKIYVGTAGDYRIALRGRKYAALYISLDGGKTYELAIDMTNNTSSANFLTGNTNDEMLKNLKVGQWVYYKAVLLVTYQSSFIGVGWGRWEPPTGVFDENGNFIGGDTTEPTINITYASSYRNSYQFQTDKFETDYFIQRKYNVSASQTDTYSKQSLVSYSGFSPWDDTLKIENLFDDDATNNMCSKNVISADNPFEMVVDIGKVVYVNYLTLYAYTKFHGTNSAIPISFTLYGSEDLNSKFKEIGVFNDLSINDDKVVVTFDKQRLRYYKIVVTKTSSNKYVALNKIEMSNNKSILNANLISPDSTMIKYYGLWEKKSQFSNFGHIYLCKMKAKVELEFTGTQFALNSYVSKDYGGYDIYVDGKKVAYVNLSDNSKKIKTTYISEALTEGKHKVTLVSKGAINLDSVAVK